MRAKNPEKKAIALRYEPDSGVETPVVVAKGRSFVAERILQMAQELNLTIEENAELTELLYAVNIGDEIPPESFVAVAEIIRYIYGLRTS